MTLTLESASFEYIHEVPVFKDVSFHLESGEIMSLLGPNGCGKTTLIKCLVGIRNFTSGRILVDGNVWNPGSRGNTHFGYVAQLGSDPVSYTVEQMVLLGRSRFIGMFDRPKENDYEAAFSAMEMVGVEGLKERSFSTLSGGERQLVLIAQALATESRLLVFDEPTSALDLVNQHSVVDLLRRLSHEKGYTVVFSSHDPSHALHISDRTLMMGEDNFYRFGAAGEVITEDSLREVFGVNSRILVHKEENGAISMGVLPILKPFMRTEFPPINTES